MDGFKVQAERVKQQLAGLTATQRMLVMALAAVMALTLMYFGRYAGTPEVAAVTAGTFSAEEMSRAETALAGAGMTYSESGGRLMVPADQRGRAYGVLAMAAALPTDARPGDGAAPAATDDDDAANPFVGESQQAFHNNARLQAALGNTFCQFPGVRSASVQINAKQEYHIGMQTVPSAVVNLFSRDPSGLPDQKRVVQGVALTVCRSVSDLRLDQVSVNVNGVPARVANAGGAGGGADDLSDAERTAEQYHTAQLRDFFLLAHIPDLSITVHCEAENASVHRDEVDYNKDRSVSLVASEREKTDNSTSTESTPREPGFAPNTGGGGGGGTGVASVDGAGGSGGGGVVPGGTTADTRDADTRRQNFVSSRRTETTIGSGKVSVRSVAVGVPHRYFVDAFRSLHPAVKDPADAELATFVTGQLAQMQGQVCSAVGLPTSAAADVVSIAVFPDVAAVQDAALSGTVATAGVGSGVVAQAIGGHAKELAVGTLAAVSLAMMFGIARKSTPNTAAFAGLPSGLAAGMIGGSDDPRDVLLASSEDVAGHAMAGDAPLDGMELDAEAIRSRQMLDQVSTMVHENPDAAAALVKRWLVRA